MRLNYKLNQFLTCQENITIEEYADPALYLYSDLAVIVRKTLKLLGNPDDDFLQELSNELCLCLKRHIEKYIDFLIEEFLEDPYQILSYFEYDLNNKSIVNSGLREHGFKYTHDEDGVFLQIESAETVKCFLFRMEAGKELTCHQPYIYEKFLFCDEGSLYRNGVAWGIDSKEYILNFFESKYKINFIQLRLISNLPKLHKLLLYASLKSPLVMRDFLKDFNLSSASYKYIEAVDSVLNHYRYLTSIDISSEQNNISIFEVSRKGGIAKGLAYLNTKKRVYRIFQDKYVESNKSRSHTVGRIFELIKNYAKENDYKMPSKRTIRGWLDDKYPQKQS